MPAFDLGLCLRMVGRAANASHVLCSQAICQLSRDVAETIIAEQTRLMDDPCRSQPEATRARSSVSVRLLTFPMRACGSFRRPNVRSPGSRTKSVGTCQVLRPRRVIQTLAIARPNVLPSALSIASAPRKFQFSRLNGWPVRSPADASPTSSRRQAHGSGPTWVASPSSQRTFTTYSLPVSPAHRQSG
jgi:hypothetical protein